MNTTTKQTKIGRWMRSEEIQPIKSEQRETARSINRQADELLKAELSKPSEPDGRTDYERLCEAMLEIQQYKAHAQRLAEALRNLVRLTHQNNAIQHAGMEVSPKAWSEMYQATLEARAHLAQWEASNLNLSASTTAKG